MGNKPSIIERAYQLARSGACERPDDVIKKLKAEGYEQVESHFAGPTLKQAMRVLCKIAVEKQAYGTDPSRR